MYATESIDNSCCSTHSGLGTSTVKVDVPDWADVDEGFNPFIAERFCGKGNYPLFVSYAPNRTLGGLSYGKLYIVDVNTGKPFPKMKGIWEEMHRRSEEGKKTKNSPSIGIYANMSGNGFFIPPGIDISITGEIRSAFGIPRLNEVQKVAFELYSIYREWKQFQNSDDYDTVEKLKDAKMKVVRMQMDSGTYNEEISKARATIKEHQDRIADLETQMNKMYEDAADAMNLLAENGITLDLEKLNPKPGEWHLPDDSDEDFFGMFIPIDWMSNGNNIRISSPSDVLPYTTDDYTIATNNTFCTSAKTC